MIAAPRSTRIRAMVVDDEPLARGILTGLLRRDPDVDSVNECGSAVAAATAIREARANLVFLDVEMPERDGFDVLETLGADVPPAVVLVTAYDAYALRAFEAGALDYLLKPFDDTRFALALARAKQRVAEALRAPETNAALVVKTAGSMTVLKLAEIDWIESADYMSRLHCGARTHLLRRSMAELEHELDAARFCRIHRTAIVRLAFVRKLELNANGEFDVVLDDGTRLPVSRRYRKAVQTRLACRQ